MGGVRVGSGAGSTATGGAPQKLSLEKGHHGVVRPEPRTHARPSTRPTGGTEIRELAVRLVTRLAVLIGAAVAAYLAMNALADEARANPIQPQPPPVIENVIASLLPDQPRAPTAAEVPKVPAGGTEPARTEPAPVTVPPVKVPPVAVPPVKVPPVAVPPVAVPPVKVPPVTVPPVAVPPVAVPPVAIPSITIPAITVPAVPVPTITIPGVRLPAVALPRAELPRVQLPGVQLPGVQLPGAELPGVQLPGVELPGVELPGVELPGVELPGQAIPPVAGSGSVGGVSPVLPAGSGPPAAPDDHAVVGPPAAAGAALIPTVGGFARFAATVCGPGGSAGRGVGTAAGVKPSYRVGGSGPGPAAPSGPLPHVDALAGVSGGAGPSASTWAVTHPGWRAPTLERGLRVHHAGSGSGRSPDGSSPSG
jgi:hypothetical protein